MIKYEIQLESPKETYIFSFDTKKEAIAYARQADDCKLKEFRKYDYDTINKKYNERTIYENKAPYRKLWSYKTK